VLETNTTSAVTTEAAGGFGPRPDPTAKRIINVGSGITDRLESYSYVVAT
jgi:hypothetical protein